MKSSGGNSHIKRELARVGVFRCRVWNDHLRRGKAVEDRSNDPVIVVRDRREYNTLPVTERYGVFNIIIGNATGDRITHRCAFSTFATQARCRSS